ncbi:MAG: hypothetical protein HC836_19310 [Richelia sp. RM2_1_2]|nr:hypothetical protein [Richelia sp. RM2_1_2]
MIKKILPTIATTAILFLTTISFTLATPLIREIKQSQASGNNGTLQTINVWNGHGVSISFYKTGETIKRVWIDDPSQILLDSDGCLKGINEDCKTSGAGLLHIRRINRLNIRGLPKVWSTHLTIITESPKGRKSYHFKVAPAGNKPQYSQIAIVPDFKPQKQRPIRKAPRIDTANISRGISKAVQDGLVSRNDELYRRVRKLIYTINNGENNLQVAANKVGVSMKLIRKLQQLGD